VSSTDRPDRSELHENEQYFFDQETLATLTSFLMPHAPVCCVCAPLLGQRLAEAGVGVTILDVDDRFSKVDGFKSFDVSRPVWLGEEFGIIVCDPPFHGVSLSQLFVAIRVLSRNDYRQPLMLSTLKRREAATLGAFSSFELAPSGYHPGYRTVEACDRNDIEFLTNLDQDALARLRDD